MTFKQDLKVWYGAVIRAGVVLGLSFFGMSITQGFCYASLETGLVTGGLYMFVELAKFYGISTTEILPKTKKAQYRFLLLP
jgi:hypothetical protein